MSGMPFTTRTEVQHAEPRIQLDGLHLLFAAAETLEKSTANVCPSPAFDSQREKRKLEVYLRRFEEMVRPQKCNKTLVANKEKTSLVGRTISKYFKDERGRRRAYKGHWSLVDVKQFIGVRSWNMVIWKDGSVNSTYKQSVHMNQVVVVGNYDQFVELFLCFKSHFVEVSKVN